MRWFLSYAIPMGIAALLWPASHAAAIVVEIVLTALILIGMRGQAEP
jgi:hypothetical protein